MCGIAGIIVRPSSAHSLATIEALANQLLYGIDSRGGDATGYVARTASGEIRLQRASCAAREFVRDRRSFPVGTRAVLLHTRFATQGSAAFPENNHPVYNGGTYCVHNGHVSNDWEVFEDLDHVARAGDVDSEAIPALVSALGFGNVPKAMGLLEGSIAVGLMDAKSGDVTLARGYSSPLVYVKTNSLIVFASTREAITRAWTSVLGTPPAADRFRFMSQGQGLAITNGGETVRGFTFKYVQPAYTYWTGARSGSWDYSNKVSTLTTPPSTSGAGSLVVQPKGSPVVERALSYLDTPLMLERCEGCFDSFPRWDLWEVEGLELCPSCEATYTREGRVR